MRMKRIAPTREALDYETNSPHQHLRECMGNSMENMHSDLTVKGAKVNEVVWQVQASGTGGGGEDKGLVWLNFIPVFWMSCQDKVTEYQ